MDPYTTGPIEKEEHKMHNNMCCQKLTCLLCACVRDFQSDYRRCTGKKTNVSFNKTEFRTAHIWNSG